MDAILSSITLPQLAFIEDQLSNNEVSSDEELRSQFLAAGLTPEQAARALTYREIYLREIFLEGHTPIVKGDEALQFDPHRCEFVRFKT